ncbi:hypothetical protein LZP96_09835 [Enterobacteriaceae bacterium 155047]|uniref:hypothetical protein n=1 Tax=Huaxiibacter chinensis TaxID=2899785 RepID=UPI002164B7CC|nr:hypothetical protein [Huaxiibacter chinensis]MCG5044337.1 hypothetical protein [Huaxiibacter chinensis]
MEIGPGEKGKIELPLGKETVLIHNRPVTYKVITASGSVIEVELPGGIEFKVTSAGDIEAINVNIYDKPKGPTEVV